MMMLSKIRLLMIAAAALAAGCNLDGGMKRSCNVQTDCLDGFQCVNQACIGGGDGGIVLVDAPGTFYGTVEPLTAQSAGLAAANYETILGLTTAPDNLGCAVVGDLSASPGAGAAVVYAKVKAESGDARCPNGVHAIMNDPGACTSLFPGELRSGCAMYRRWSSTGQQVAYQLAIGGYASVQDAFVTDMLHRCSVELSLNFAGGVTIAKTFMFDYNPFAPASAFCQH